MVTENLKKDGTCKYGCHICPNCLASLPEIQGLKDSLKATRMNAGDYHKYYKKQIAEKEAHIWQLKMRVKILENLIAEPEKQLKLLMKQKQEIVDIKKAKP